ncbi:MAG: dipeptide epimerase [Ignavibacteriaceae bacterium]|nr:dipeptide epimerase [Ignavibacteriaceae bacterium]MCW8818114.1 dipeptide epimerase [Ignavibacteriaceae bacterium]MCW8961828.1 dipeptide epimerase [Ignavibacteriaceae bacterium]
MKLTYYPYTLELKQRFTISFHSRLTTPTVMVEIEQDGLTGYGEASLPPYLYENQQSVISFLNKVDLKQFERTENLYAILQYIDEIEEGNNAAKAAVDIALHDLAGKMINVPLYRYLNINIKDDLYSSYTLGISEVKSLKEKIVEAADFKILKVKLGTEDDKKIIKMLRLLTNKPFYVDVNQGWQDKYLALDMINFLKEQNVILVEQPLPMLNLEDTAWLTERSPLPIIADEAVQNLNDLEKIKNIYSGVNIKLMKAGGINKAYRMILKAKQLNLKVMIGCMTESSCAITAASHLSPLADWIDLDGAELISNDLFSGMKIYDGKIIIPEGPGLGVKKLRN